MSQQQQHVVLYKVFSPNKLTANAIGKNRMGGNQVNLSYMGNRSIAVQLPSMLLPFGLQEYAPAENPSAVKYSIDVSFRSLSDDDTRQSAFRTIAESIDERMIDMAVANSTEWFGKTLTSAVVRELYRPLVKLSKQPEKYDPTLKIKIRNVVGLMRDDLQAGAVMKSIVEFTPIWFLNKQFGVNVTLVNYEIVVQSSDNRPTRVFEFVSDEDEEQE
jgi:hypothetical protein